MNPFDPCNWVYDAKPPSRDVRALAGRLHQAIPGVDPDTLIDALAFGGGKSFGNSLCEIAARSDDRLRVPDWTFIEPGDQTRIVSGEASPLEPLRRRFCSTKIMVRSSDVTEDWHDASSGLQDSFPCTVDDLTLFLARVHRRCQPVVIQRRVRGIGLVVDIAWSALLGRVVTRIATGRAFRDGKKIGYSSATWDAEGLFGLWDAHKRVPAARLHHGAVLHSSVYKLPLDALAETLYAALSALGIWFGVQLELVINPNKPRVWNLIQIRPSPRQVMNTLAFADDLGKPLTATPIVNRAFDVRGTVKVIRERERKQLIKCAYNFVSDEVENVCDECRGKIVVWEQPTGAGSWLCAVQALANHGALAQISRGVISINTAHANVKQRSMLSESRRTDRDASRRSMWEEANQSSAVLGVDDAGFDAIMAWCDSKPESRLRAVSDGIVGSIYPV